MSVPGGTKVHPFGGTDTPGSDITIKSGEEPGAKKS
jgi:hypothetical protein